MPSAPDVYDSLSLVIWLGRWFQWWQGERRSHSHRAFARRANVGPGTLENVLARRRGASAATLMAFNKVLELDPDRSSYLLLLGELEDAVSIDERLAVLRRISAHPGARAARECVGRDIRYLRRWTNIAVRELANMGPIPDDVNAVRQRLAFVADLDAVQSSIEELLELGLLERHAGMLTAPDRAVQTAITTAGTQALHLEMLGIAARALLEMGTEKRFFAGLTLGIPAARLPELQAEAWRFLSQLRDLADAAVDPDSVVQVQVQMFPLATFTTVDED